MDGALPCLAPCPLALPGALEEPPGQWLGLKIYMRLQQPLGFLASCPRGSIRHHARAPRRLHAGRAADQQIEAELQSRRAESSACSPGNLGATNLDQKAPKPARTCPELAPELMP